MITQLIRVRNVFLPNDHPRAFGYVVGKTRYRGDDRLTIAWIGIGLETLETLSAHPDNVAIQTPYVFITNQRKAQ